MTPTAEWLADALAYTIALAPIVLGLGSVIVEGSIRPRLIPRATIARLAQDLIHRHPDAPEAAALLEEHAAWHRSESYEQGMWRRVRREVGLVEL